MLLTGLIHPQILEALGEAGHGSTVLISDGNFPALTATSPGARRVYLNLTPGVLSVTEILAAMQRVVAFEMAVVMGPDDGHVPPIHGEIANLLGPGIPVDRVSRHDFYAMTRSADLGLAVISGDVRLYGNVLLTIGLPPQSARRASAS